MRWVPLRPPTSTEVIGVPRYGDGRPREHSSVSCVWRQVRPYGVDKSAPPSDYFGGHVAALPPNGANQNWLIWAPLSLSAPENREARNRQGGLWIVLPARLPRF